MPSLHLALAQQLAALLAELPQVEAVALGGSRGGASATVDSASDIDVYVYTRGDIPLVARQAIVARSGGTSQASLGLHYWGPGDEWLHAPSGIEVDLVYFDARWMEEQITRVVDECQASLGYTTCFCYTVRHAIALADPSGWFATLQARCQGEYPEALRRNIVALNHPLLRGIIPAYAHQLAKAALRHDLVSINHRLAALLASYFDILLAVNRQWHPGEKRLVEFALQRCQALPTNMEADLAALLLLTAADVADLPARVTRLLDHLDALLEREGLRDVMR
jgi:hypothetical protein